MILYVVGIFAIPWIPWAPTVGWVYAFAGLFAAACLVPAARRWAPLTLGLLWGSVYAWWGLEHRLPEALAKRDWQVVGVVEALPEAQGRLTRFELAVESLAPVRSIGLPVPELRRLRLSWHNAPAVPLPGQRWQLKVRLKPPHGFANPGIFDYEHWLFSREVDATGYVRDSGDNRLLEEAWRGRLDRWRFRLSEHFMAHTPAAVAPFLAALAVGDKRQLLDEHWEVLRRTGTLHLMVISGLHIGLIAWLGYYLGRALERAWFRGAVSRLPLGVVFGIGLAIVYAALAGFSLPTQRALVMVSALLLGAHWGRQVALSQRYLLALALVVTLDPLAFWSPGFWLSFMAVALLLTWSQVAAQGHWLRRNLGVHLMLLVGLAPWLIFFFQQVSWVAPLANLLAIPLVGLLIVPATLVVALGLALEVPGTGVLVDGVSWVFEWVWAYLEVLSGVPGLPFAFRQPALGGMLLAVVAIFVFLLARRAFGWLLLLWLLPLVVPNEERPEEGAYKIRMLDVGQGLAVLIETRNHRLLYDTGGRWGSNGSAASSVILPYLRARGIDRLDTLVVSHADQDHAGGVGEIFAELPVAMALTPSQRLRDRYPQMLSCLNDVTWHWDGVRFRVLHPPRNGPGDENERSCVLMVDNGSPGLLLTGDISTPVELQLIGLYGEALRSGVLVASHHGSADGSSLALLRTVEPHTVLVSAGLHNRYGHPARSLLKRVAAQGGRVVNTARQGAIEVQVDAAGSMALSRFRDRAVGYWRAKDSGVSVVQ